MRKKLLSIIATLSIIIGILPNITVYAMTAQDGANWASSRIGQGIDTDGYYGYQCKDFVNAYCQQNWGFTPPGNAKDLINYNYPSGWQKIKNTPDFLPQPGDIAVWTYGSYATYGHCAIILSANLSNFVSVDQNWYDANGTVGSPAAKVQHNYNGFWGVVRPKFDNPNPPIQPIHKDNNPHVRNGFFTFKNAASGTFMNVWGGGDSNGTAITTWSYDGSIDQRFNVVHQGNGKYKIYAECSSDGTNRVVDVLRNYADLAEGQKVDLYDPNDDTAQLFYIWPVGNNEYVFEIAAKDGYVIAPPSGAAGSNSKDSQLTLQRYTGAAHQKWRLCNNNGKDTTPNISYSDGSYKVDTDGDSLNMRSGAGTSHNLVGSVPDKVTLRITQVSGNWGYTSYNGTDGWVCLDFTVYTVTLDSISIAKQPNKVSYFAGDNFDSTGLEISANYSNGQKEIIGSGFSVDCDLNNPGSKTVTVTYNGKSVSFTVNVESLQVDSISLYDENITKKYNVGDSLVSEEIGLRVNYSNGVENLIKNGFTTDYDFSTPGTKTVTVSYGGKSTSYQVEVLQNASVSSHKLQVSSGQCYQSANGAVDIRLTSKDIYDGNMTIQYDASKLKINDVKACGALLSRQVTINKNYASDKIRVSFAGTTPVVSDDAVLKIEFTPLAGSSGLADILITEAKMYDSMGRAVGTDISNGTIEIIAYASGVTVNNVQSISFRGQKIVTANVSSDEVICCLAAYKNGALLECDRQYPSSGSVELSVADTPGAQYKFMVWNAALQPMMAAKDIY